ncbi:MAG: TauD/TfdA dioxygenase family protein [Acidimicrobiales bacterium]
MGATTLDLEPLDATFGATVRGIELRDIDDATFAALKEAWLEFALLVFPGQFFTTDEQNAFALRFGELEFPATPISNIGRSGRVHSNPDDDLVKSLRGNEGWHFDSTYMPVQAKGAVFSAEIVPSHGAATGWADMRAAYEALDDETRDRIQDMKAYHSLYYSQGRAGYLPRKAADGSYGMYGYHDEDVSLRPLVKIHPDTGRPNLLIGRHAHNIIGMEPEESQRFLDELAEWACQPPRVYHHQWEPGDAVIWDNRRLMHRGTPFDMTQPRRMWHTRIAGEPESELAVNHTEPTQPSPHPQAT